MHPIQTLTHIHTFTWADGISSQKRLWLNRARWFVWLLLVCRNTIKTSLTIDKIVIDSFYIFRNARRRMRCGMSGSRLGITKGGNDERPNSPNNIAKDHLLSYLVSRAIDDNNTQTHTHWMSKTKRHHIVTLKLLPSPQSRIYCFANFSAISFSSVIRAIKQILHQINFRSVCSKVY